FMAAMCLLFVVDRAPVRNPVQLRLRLDLSAAAFGLTVLLTSYILFVYRSNLRFVSFGDAVYEQRFANRALGADVITRYGSAWLTSVLVPICLAFGVVRRRWSYFAVGTIACVAIYMAVAAKFIILLPVVYLLCAAAFAGRKLANIYKWVTGGLAVLIVGLLFVSRGATGATWITSSLILQRTVGNGGQIAIMYYDFFRFHPQTDYSHVAALRPFTHKYPYGTLGVGQVIGQFFFSPDMNANASFWATDGFAAMDLWGVPLATFACAALLFVLNMVTRDHDPVFTVL